MIKMLRKKKKQKDTQISRNIEKQDSSEKFIHIYKNSDI